MSKGRKRGFALAGVGILGVLAYFFRGLIPGLGDDVDTVEPPEAAAVVEVVAKGEQCTVAEKARPCADVCADFKAKDNVLIDGTDGAHAAVTALEKCLAGKGVEVSVKNR